MERVVGKTLVRIRSAEGIEADLVLSLDAAASPGRVVEGSAAPVVARVAAWKGGYDGEMVTLEHALTRGIKALPARSALVIAPLMVDEVTFPVHPNALIVLNTLVRLVHTQGAELTSIDVLVDAARRSDWEAAFDEVYDTMIGTPN